MGGRRENARRLMAGNIGVERSCSYGCLGEAWCISISDSRESGENYISSAREREEETCKPEGVREKQQSAGLFG